MTGPPGTERSSRGDSCRDDSGRVGERNETTPRDSGEERVSRNSTSLCEVLPRTAGVPAAARSSSRDIRVSMLPAGFGADRAQPEAVHSPSPSHSSGPTRRIMNGLNTRGVDVDGESAQMPPTSRRACLQNGRTPPDDNHRIEKGGQRREPSRRDQMRQDHPPWPLIAP